MAHTEILLPSSMSSPCLPRLSSPLWLGPSYMLPRPSFVCVRAKAILFDNATSSQASAFACPGDVFLASAMSFVEGYSMVSLDSGAVEARFLRPATSADFGLNPSLLVLDLDSPAIRAQQRKNARRQGWSLMCLGMSGQKGNHCGVASGPGCVPWNSSLRPFAFSKLPLPKTFRGNGRLDPPSVATCSVANSFLPVLSSFGLVSCGILDFANASSTVGIASRPIDFALDPAPFSPQQIFAPTLEYISGVPLIPVENFVSSHCWWFATADLTGHSPQLLMPAISQLAVIPAPVLEKLLAPVTATEQIALLVSLLGHLYPTGLLILHQSACVCFLFLPHTCRRATLRSGLPSVVPKPQLFSMHEAAAWLHAFPHTPVMLFSQDPSSSCGHFVACRRHVATKCHGEPPVALLPGLLHPNAAMIGKGIFSDSCIVQASPTRSQPALNSDGSDARRTQLTVSPTAEWSRPAIIEEASVVSTPPSHVRQQYHFSSSASEAGDSMSAEVLSNHGVQASPASQSPQPPSVDFEDASAFPASANRFSNVSRSTCEECPKQTGTVASMNPATDSPASTLIDSSSQATAAAYSSSNLTSPHAIARVTVANWSALEDDPIQSFSEENSIESFSPNANRVSQPLVSAGCSCIGFYAICLCGGAEYMRASPVDLDAGRQTIGMEGGVCEDEVGPQNIQTNPEMRGGMVPSTPPQQHTPSSTYWQLLALGVPAPTAREAARRFSDDLDAALDWACASDRRHVRVAPAAIEVVDSASESGSPRIPSSASRALPASGFLSVPASWSCNAAPVPADVAACSIDDTAAEARTWANLLANSNGPAIDLVDSPADETCPCCATSSQNTPALPVPVSCLPKTVPDSASGSSVPDLSSTGVGPVMPLLRPFARNLEEVVPIPSAVHEDLTGRPPGDMFDRMPPPCFMDDPAAEVRTWVNLLANSNGLAARDPQFWARMPCYTQYILKHSLEEIAAESLACIQKYRGLDLSAEQAAKLPCPLTQTAILPLAVACEYLHHGCGLPAIFSFDLFQACLASCQHKSLEVAIYAAKSKSFSCKARWWACPTGDPNAGKSPTCSFVMTSFSKTVKAFPHLFLHDQHWIGVGNNNRIQNRLRALGGTLLLYGPESKPILDPNFPTKKTVDTGKYLDLTRWLESANGGAFEWGTGAEESQRQKQRSDKATLPPVVLDPTNINLCLFQQFSLFEDWWCQVEALHKCGFTARILMSPTQRAIIDPALGLQDSACVGDFMQRIWAYVASHYGPQHAEPDQQLRPSLAAQQAIRAFYYDLHEEDQKGGWGSAMKSALGKMEYHIPNAACLSSLAAAALGSSSVLPLLDDNSIKASFRHFALRVCQTCAIVDSTVCRMQHRQKGLPSNPLALPSVRPMAARVLETCLKNPILESHLSSHFSAFKGADKSEERISLMQELQRLGLGEVKEARRRQGGQTRCVEFHRFELNAAVSAALSDLGVSQVLWPSVSPSLPPMAGAGIFAEGPTVHHRAAPSMQGVGTGAGKRPAANLLEHGEYFQFQDHEPRLPRMAGAGKLGRPAHEQTPYTVANSLVVELGFENKQAFLEHERQWASALLPDKVLNIRFQWYNYKAGFKVLLWCNSCAQCQNKAGWKGYSVYTLATKKVERTYTPLEKHGEPTATKAWTPLTSTTENALKQYVATHARFTTQDLVKVVEEHQSDRPDDAWLQRWGNNHRPRRPEGSSPSQWVESDWRQLIRDLGTIDGLQDVADCLKVAASSFDDPKNTIIVFCNPKLTATSLNMLENQTYVKLCGDGTFRLTDKEWIFLSLGALSKHYAPKASVFRTTFNPVLFALTNNETEQTYTFFFEAACQCALRFADIRLPEVCGQYHADLHWGEDAAQKNVFPAAQKVADWAHFTGACTRSVLAKKHPAAGDQKFMAFRKGVWVTARNHLSPAGKTLMPLIERAFYCMRSVPTALLFHSIAHSFFEMLSSQNPPEEAAAKALFRYYFRRVPAAEAKEHWGLSTWVGDASFIYLADWWYGAQRLQPGSCSGTQSQESWHKHKLKSYMGLKASLPAFSAQLAKFTSSRLKDLQASSQSLPDVPKEPFPDRAVLFDSPWLTKLGRSSADQYRRTGAYDVHEHDGNAFFGMQRTLAKYDSSVDTWNFTEDSDVPPVPAETASLLARLCRATDSESLNNALVDLDLSLSPRHLDKLLRLLNSSVLVAFGTEASKFWRRQPLEGQQTASHTHGLCHFCHEFSVHGSCEHLHVAFLHLKLISLQAAQFPKRQRTANPLQEPSHILLPSRPRATASSSARKPAIFFNWAHTSRFLAANQADTWAEYFRSECIDVHMISAMGVAELKAVLQHVPAGVLFRLHAAASQWLEEAPLSGLQRCLVCFCFCSLCCILPGQDKSARWRGGRPLTNGLMDMTFCFPCDCVASRSSVFFPALRCILALARVFDLQLMWQGTR